MKISPALIGFGSGLVTAVLIASVANASMLTLLLFYLIPLPLFLAGAGVKGGFTYGETDELGFSVARDKVHVHDLQATILKLLGFDHERLTYRFQGRDFRLTDVHGRVIKELLD